MYDIYDCLGTHLYQCYNKGSSLTNINMTSDLTKGHKQITVTKTPNYNQVEYDSLVYPTF